MIHDDGMAKFALIVYDDEVIDMSASVQVKYISESPQVIDMSESRSPRLVFRRMIWYWCWRGFGLSSQCEVLKVEYNSVKLRGGNDYQVP